MSTEQNKQDVLRWREEIWNKRNLDVVDELAAPDYVGHIAGIPAPVRGPEALKHLFAAALAAFDTRVRTNFLLAEGDLVVARDTNWYKNTRGGFQGIPPTGKELTFTSTDIYRIVGGRIVEQWFEADLTGMLHQLGRPVSGDGAPPPTEETKAVIRRFAEEVLTEKRLDRADALVAPDYRDHAALPGQAPGLEGARQRWALWGAAVPDLHVTTEEMVAEGDRVAVRWAAEGTQRGTLLGIPPSGRSFRFGGMSIFRVAEGKIIEQAEAWDKLDLLRQLGAIPAPGPSEP